MRIRFSDIAGRDRLERAADMAGVLLEVRDNHCLPRLRAWEYRCGLLPAPGGKYRRDSATQYAENGRRPRRVNAVCWHGHRAFFRALYALLPAGVTCHITTGLATYRDAEHFERTHRASDRNIGSQYRPVLASEACQCDEEV